MQRFCLRRSHEGRQEGVLQFHGCPKQRQLIQCREGKQEVEIFYEKKELISIAFLLIVHGRPT